MLPAEVIRTKRDGGALSEAQIQAFVQGLVDDRWSEGQDAAIKLGHQLVSGPLRAQRMAFHLLQHDRDGALKLAAALSGAVAHVHHCERCHTFSEQALCIVCASRQ